MDQSLSLSFRVSSKLTSDNAVGLVELPLSHEGSGVVGLLEDGSQKAVALSKLIVSAVTVNAIAERVAPAQQR